MAHAPEPGGVISGGGLRASLRALATPATTRDAGGARAAVSAPDSHALSEVSRLLGELRGALEGVGHDGTGLEAARERVDAIIGSIRSASDVPDARSAGIVGREALLVDVTQVAANVSGYAIRHADLGVEDDLDIRVEVIASAQVAGMLLSFGTARLDLGSASDSFAIEIGGSDGSRLLRFASGTTLSDVAAAINFFTSETGVRAVVSGGNTGVRLESQAFGSDAFVSVRVEDDGLIGDRENIGVYGLDATDAGRADTSSHRDFAFVSNVMFDYGQDVAGLVNGYEGAGRGLSLYVDSPAFGGRIDLRPDGAGAHAQDLGRLDAFTLLRRAREDWVGGPGNPGGAAPGAPSTPERVAALAGRTDAARVLALLGGVGGVPGAGPHT